MDAWMVGWMDGCKWVSVMATERRLFGFSFILIKLSLWKLKVLLSGVFVSTRGYRKFFS